jgi:hypothetical protein
MRVAGDSSCYAHTTWEQKRQPWHGGGDLFLLEVVIQQMTGSSDVADGENRSSMSTGADDDDIS